jgi:hypothetical protein
MAAIQYEKVCGTRFASSCLRGTCIDDTCVCDAGWEHDHLFFRTETCSSPVGLFEATHAMVLITSVIAVVLGWRRVVVDTKHQVVSRDSRLVGLFILSSLLLGLGSMASLIQRYGGVYMWFSLGFFFLVQPLSYASTMFTYFELTYKSLGKEMPVQTRQYVLASLGLFYVLTITPLALVWPAYVVILGDPASPEYPVHTYNFILSVILSVFPLHLLISLPLGYFVTRDLVGRVNAMLHNLPNSVSDSRSQSLTKVKKRLLQFRVVNLVVAPLMEVLFFPVGFGMAYLLAVAPSLPWFTLGGLLQGNLIMISHIIITADAVTKKPIVSHAGEGVASAGPDGGVGAGRSFASGFGVQGNVLLRHKGGTTTVVSEWDLDMIANRGVVIDDNQGETVSVMAQHSITLDEHDALLYAVLPGAAKAVDAFSALVLARGSSKVVSCVIIAGAMLLLALLAGLLCQQVPDSVGILFAFVGLSEAALLIVAFSKEVLSRLVRTSFFFWRVVIFLTGTTLLGVSLGDARAGVCVSLYCSQILLFCSDALLERYAPIRFTICVMCVLANVLVLVLLMANLIPCRNYVVKISDSFDYALLQLVRDIFMAQTVLGGFECAFVLKGRTSRRFLHIQEPVTYVVRTLEQEQAAKGRSKRQTAKRVGGGLVNASELEAQSGYVVQRQPDDRVVVYVDEILIKQSDAVFLHVLSPELGHAVVRFFSGRAGQGLNTVFSIAAAAVLFVPQVPPYICVVSALVIALRTCSRASVCLLRILVRLEGVQISFFFLGAWFVLTVMVFPTPFAVFLTFLLVLSVVEVLKDSQALEPSKISRLWEKLLLAFFFNGFGCCMVWDLIPGFSNATLDLRPDLHMNNALAFRNDVSVVDLYQTSVDLTFTLGLRHLVGLCTRALASSQNELENVHAPVVPVYARDQGAEGVVATSASASVAAAVAVSAGALQVADAEVAETAVVEAEDM